MGKRGACKGRGGVRGRLTYRDIGPGARLLLFEIDMRICRRRRDAFDAYDLFNI